MTNQEVHTHASRLKIAVAGVLVAVSCLAYPASAGATTIFAAPIQGGLTIHDQFPFGEMFTVPGADTNLLSFAFGLTNSDPNNFATYFGYVYAWDAGLTRPTGAALFSDSQTLAPFAGSTIYELVTFTPNLQLTAGQQYIAFIGIRTNPGGQGLACNFTDFFCVNQSPLTTFYQGPAGGEGAWTTNSWATQTYRAQFNITLGPGQQADPAVPEPATLLLVATGAGVAAIRRRRPRV